MSIQPPDAGILDIPIDELPLSVDFKARSRKMGFATLREIADCDQHWLRDRLYFDMDWYMEALRFMKERGVVRYFNK